MSTKAYEGTYNGEQAIWLQAGRYEAVVLPDVGANLIAFRDIEKEYRFLREPALEEMEAFKERPIVHGIPVLFPPNRYEDGKFLGMGRYFNSQSMNPRQVIICTDLYIIFHGQLRISAVMAMKVALH